MSSSVNERGQPYWSSMLREVQKKTQEPGVKEQLVKRSQAHENMIRSPKFIFVLIIVIFNIITLIVISLNFAFILITSRDLRERKSLCEDTLKVVEQANTQLNECT